MVTVTISGTPWPTGRTIALRVWAPAGAAASTSLMTETSSGSGIYGYSGSQTLADDPDPYEAEIRDITDAAGASTALKFDAATDPLQLVWARGELGIVSDQILQSGGGTSSGDNMTPVDFGPTTTNTASTAWASILAGTLADVITRLGLAVVHKTSGGPGFNIRLMVSIDTANFFEVVNVFGGTSLDGNSLPVTYQDGSKADNFFVPIPLGVKAFRVEAQPMTSAALQILATGVGAAGAAAA